MAKLRDSKKIRLKTNPSITEIKSINIGDIIFLDGIIYTAREGVYKRVLEDKKNLPLDLPKVSAANFHCSPAAVQNENGEFNLGSVTATASFRFSKWIGEWLKTSQAKLIIGKGGMSSNDYKNHFVPNRAIYLTTVGYGTGALLGRGVKKVKDLFWKKELGLAQAMWVIEVENFGPFLAESDMKGNSLFERENKKIAEKIKLAYEGTRPAVLKRFGETDNPEDELI